MIAVLIPMLARRERAQGLVDSIAGATTARHRVVFVCSSSEPKVVKACAATGADVLIANWTPADGDFARKINYGYDATSEEFLLCGASDLVFHPGWDLAALGIAESSNAGVIGTNDMHNPRVIKGRHATHPLVRRAYIERYGGTFDNSGAIYCEHYSHQYTDDELVQTAIRRKQWAFAANSRVEHLHPFFKGAQMDSTYRKAFADSRADRKLFQERMIALRRQRTVI